ncbi:MAG: hypothetical protein A3F40_00505 [Chlamydiae bacterium RIFCSPHIGHO2_12_FULL_27_8]|nr:MAG: hypothetical protein A3F40_00505 [Chlamydiae bacterium RIFCSPHIGHO2_12_FULL_27_8]
MNIKLFLVVIAILGGLCLWIGKISSKNIKTNDDYFLMGRKLSVIPLCLTFFATQLGGGTLLGAAQEAYQKGWIVLFYPLGVALGFFALGMGFGSKLKNLNISTTAEIFEKIYKSRIQRYIASIFSIISLFFVLVAQGIAAKKFFISMNFQSPLIFVIFWTILILYTVMGGLEAVVNTDVLQTLFMILILGLTFFSINLGNTEIVNNFSIQNIFVSDVPWITWLLIPFLFMLIEQDMGQRCFAAKNNKIVTFATIGAGILLLISSSIAIYFGVMAKKLGLTISENSSILVESVKLLTTPTITTLFMCAIFMAIISTADSILCSISSNVSYDFLISKNISSKKQVTISKAVTLFFGLASISFVFIFNDVVTMLMFGYQLTINILFVSIFMALISKNPSRLGAYISMIAGAISFIFIKFIRVPISEDILTVGLSFLGYFIGKKMDKKRVALNEIED